MKLDSFVSLRVQLRAWTRFIENGLTGAKVFLQSKYWSAYKYAHARRVESWSTRDRD